MEKGNAENCDHRHKYESSVHDVEPRERSSGVRFRLDVDVVVADDEARKLKRMTPTKANQEMVAERTHEQREPGHYEGDQKRFTDPHGELQSRKQRLRAVLKHRFGSQGVDDSLNRRATCRNN